MVDALMQVSPLAGLMNPGRYGRSLEGGPGVALSQVHPCEISSVIVAKGKQRNLASAMKKEFGVALPGMGQSASARGLSVNGVQPDSWLCVAPDAGAGSLAAKLDEKIGKLAMVTSQSHGRTLLKIEGARARDVLAKMTPVDLQPDVFKPGMVAATQMGHVGTVLVCREAQAFELIVPSTFAESLWTGLTELALEWGYEVR